jgi:uncharacterized protein (DUF1684 family)
MLAIVLWSLLFPSTGQADEYFTDVQRWRQQRLTALTAEEGFLSLAGLYWLSEGKNTFGAAEDNDLIFPDGTPSHMGYFLLEDGRVRVHITAPGVTQLDTAGVEQSVAMLDFPNIQNADPPALHFRSLRFYPIERDGRYGVRLKDTQSPTRLHFPGISSFDVDPTWRIEGRFEPFAEPRSIDVPSIIGTVSQTPWPGNVVFSAGGEQHRLAVFGEASDRQFFVVFADRSNGQETYGGGRFLVVDHHPDGRATIDFNKAYSPPCAFTPYATCPLPPAQNRLDLYVRAGEQYSGEH